MPGNKHLEVSKDSIFSLNSDDGYETVHWFDSSGKQMLIRNDGSHHESVDTANILLAHIEKAGGSLPTGIFINAVAESDKRLLKELWKSAPVGIPLVIQDDSANFKRLMDGTEIGRVIDNLLKNADIYYRNSNIIKKAEIYSDGSNITVSFKIANKTDLITSVSSLSALSKNPQLNLQAGLREGSLDPSLVPGQKAPTIEKILSARITSIISDSATLTDVKRNQVALDLYRKANVKPDNPLYKFSDLEEVKRIIYEQGADAAAKDSTKFKQGIGDLAIKRLNEQGRKPGESTIRGYVNTELDPYIDQVKHIPDQLAHEINLNAISLYRAAVPIPVGHPFTETQRLQYAIYNSPFDPRNYDYQGYKSEIAKNVAMELLKSKLIEVKDFEQKVSDLEKALAAQLDQYISQAERNLLTDPIRVTNDEVRELIRNIPATNPVNKDLIEIAAEDFFNRDSAQRKGIQRLQDTEKLKLKQELEKMSIVMAMYSSDFSGFTGNGEILLRSLVVLPSAESQKHFSQYKVGFGDQVHKGLSIFSALVEPDKRPPSDRITNIEVNPDDVKPKGMFRKDEIHEFRADAARKNDKVRLSIMSSVKTIVHELGHQVEFHLSLAEWMDIQQILQSRKKSENLIDIYGNGKEPAYDVDMPATGNYSAKVYGTGDTEVISMAMEFFSNPKTAREIITKDPLVAATVLRAIRPKEFKKSISPEMQRKLPRGEGFFPPE